MIPTFNIPLLLTVAAIMGGLFIFISLNNRRGNYDIL